MSECVCVCVCVCDAVRACACSERECACESIIYTEIINKLILPTYIYLW